MLQSNYISSLLNLKGVSILLISTLIAFTIALPRRPHICPCCSRKTNNLHLLDKIFVYSPSLSHVISIDEFKGNANNEKFQFILLENMLNKSEKLREAYELKEAFFELTKQEDKKKGLKKWINVVVKYNLKEFNNVSETMCR